MANTTPSGNRDDELAAFVRRAGDLEHIVDRKQIIALLTQVKDSRMPLAVNLPGTDDRYGTFILGIDASNGGLLLDELTPRTRKVSSPKRDKLFVSISLKGATLSFAGNITGAAVESGTAYYRVGLPSKVIYRQVSTPRRNGLAQWQVVPVLLTRDGSSILEGRLVEIIPGGSATKVVMAFADDLRAAEEFSPGDRLPRCSICFPDGSRVSGEFEVRLVQRDREHRAVRIGGRLTKLDQAQTHIVSRFLSTQQR